MWLFISQFLLFSNNCMFLSHNSNLNFRNFKIKIFLRLYLPLFSGIHNKYKENPLCNIKKEGTFLIQSHNISHFPFFPFLWFWHKKRAYCRLWEGRPVWGSSTQKATNTTYQLVWLLQTTNFLNLLFSDRPSLIGE